MRFLAESVCLAAATLTHAYFLSSTFLGPTRLCAAEVDFAREIQPILARNCYSCHGPDLQEGGLRFDERTTLLEEADSGFTAIVPGRSADSELWRRVASDDEYERMPPEGDPLSEEELSLLRVWIDEGAEFTEHWAFQPIQTPTIPDVVRADWCANPIDNFVASRLEEAELVPADRAAAPDLIRRVYLDVTGLPPSPEDVRGWCSDWNEIAYERLVDQLLSDPSFGERWARAWLDVVRYAETNSFERDNAKPNVWKYRDYVIRSMNHDKPYDQFIREQIAGDELDTVTADTLTATGYYRLGLWDDEPADPKQALFDGFDDLVSTTSQGILALTLNCARCHDHKIDPLMQRDYYSLVAFLRDVTPYGTRGNQTGFNQLPLDPELAARYEALRRREKSLQRDLRAIEQSAIEKMTATDQRATEGPERERVLREKLVQFLDQATHEKYEHLQGELRKLRQEKQALPPLEHVLGLAKLDADPEPTHILLRGSPHSEGELVEPAFPRLLGGGVPEIPAPGPGAGSAGRRRVLADWLTSDDNWLTARVIVNRLWLHYFGRGIVRSPNNFGLMGEPPTHPRLIDYLATELIRHDWNLKHVHRLILLSSTYRLSTEHDEEADARDPANDLFWRQNMRRLSAEQVRDSVLAVTGGLNKRKYGPSMYPTLSEEVLASQSRPGSGWGDSSPEEQARRTIYIHVKRSLPVPLLEAFDFPETDISCEARFLTVQPGQALTMLNSGWIQLQAERLQQRLEREVGTELEAQVARCLELVLGRPATAADEAELIKLVGRLKSEHQLNETQARRAMCLVALNLNAFLYVN